MPVAKLDKQQVLGALKATGSFDQDVLYARKEEMLAESKKMKMLGTFPIVMGVVMCLTIIGAPVGIPFLIFGFWVRKRIRTNTQTADSAYGEYLNSINPVGRAAAV
jgi:hypothetical protein